MPRVRRRWVPFLDPGPSLSPAQVSVMTRRRCVRVLLFGTWLDECPRFPGVLEIIPSHTQVSQGTRCYELGFCPSDFPELSKTSLKNRKNKKFLPWPTFKTDIIKCSRFLDFFTFSTFFSFVKICLFFSKISITDGVILPIATDVLGPTKVPTIRYWGKFHF